MKKKILTTLGLDQCVMAISGAVAATVLGTGDVQRLAPLAFFLTFFILLYTGMSALEGRCPRCGGMFARSQLSRTYARDKEREVISHAPSGRHYRWTSKTKLYRARFVCRRCELRWEGWE